jgi:terminase large subunit-like protein
MTVAALRREVAKLKVKAGQRQPKGNPTVEAIRQDPAQVLARAGMEPDPWQQDLLRSRSSRTLLLCSRQSGKSTTAAAEALKTALLEPGSLTLLLSPTLRQSGELFRDKVLRFWRGLGYPLRGRSPTQLELTLANGSRIVSLPGEEGTIRGFSGVRLLVIDEAARVQDDLYKAVRPMLATSRGRLIALSTAFARMGWYFDCWTGKGQWRRVKVKAGDCPRIPKEFLEEEWRALGPRWYAMEYECEFQDAVAALFSQADIEAAMSDTVRPLFVRR